MGALFFSKRTKGQKDWAISRRLISLLVSVLFVPMVCVAQTRTNVIDHTHDVRGEPDLTVCSQNLENFGSLKDMARRGGVATEAARADKLLALVKRFQEAGCTVVAVQELLGGDELQAKAALEEIAKVLQFRTNKRFTAYVGPSNDKVSRVGFLIEEGRTTFDGLTSYVSVELPKISEDQPARKFARGPLEIRLRLEGKGASATREIILVTFHFKSRAFNSKDGSDLSWGTYRMEMSEALRRVVVRRHGNVLQGNGNLLVLLGDRNSHFDSASAKILTGELILPRFQLEAPCRLTKRGVPLCQSGAVLPPAFVSLLTADPQTFRTPGSYRFGNTFSWIDDILVPVANLPFAYAVADAEGDYESGTLTAHPEASDHALVYSRFNW